MTRKERIKFRISVKSILSICINIAETNMKLNDYFRVIECLRLADWISDKFLSKMDEMKRFTVKAFKDSEKRFHQYLHFLIEFDLILMDFLKGNSKYQLNNIPFDRSFEENEQKLCEINEILYKKFDYGNLNKNKLIIEVEKKKNEESTNTFEKKLSVNSNKELFKDYLDNSTKLNTNILENINSNISDSKIEFLSIRSLKNSMSKSNQIFFGGKKFCLEKDADYKPKILTKNDCNY